MKEKNVYHALGEAELTGGLRDHSECFDLIVSADTLVYFGDLRGIIAALGKRCAQTDSGVDAERTVAVGLVPTTVCKCMVAT
jgi:predicted TPR repeat methyltransferase